MTITPILVYVFLVVTEEVDCAVCDVCDDSEEAEEAHKQEYAFAGCTVAVDLLHFVSSLGHAVDPHQPASATCPCAVVRRAKSSCEYHFPSSRATLC